MGQGVGRPQERQQERQQEERGGGGGLARAFITAPVMVTFPVAYSAASIIWAIAGQINPAWDTTHIWIGILITLLVSVAVLLVDLLSTQDELTKKSLGLRGVYFLFNFVVLLAAVLHIQILPMDATGS